MTQLSDLQWYHAHTQAQSGVRKIQQKYEILIIKWLTDYSISLLDRMIKLNEQKKLLGKLYIWSLIFAAFDVLVPKLPFWTKWSLIFSLVTSLVSVCTFVSKINTFIKFSFHVALYLHVNASKRPFKIVYVIVNKNECP